MANVQLQYTQEVMSWIKRWLKSHVDFSQSNNETVRLATFSTYSIRPNLRSIYTLFLFLNTAVFAAGLSLNTYLIYRVIKKRLYHDHIILYLINIAVSDIIQLTFVLPYTLCVSLFEYWFLGQALCYTGPWFQHLPNSISTLTHLLLALHRYRQIMCPLKEPLPVWLCLLAVWIVAACVNLPVSIFHRYIDIEDFWSNYLQARKLHHLPLKPIFFRGISMCVQSIKQSLRDFARATFIVLFALPFVVIVFLYVRSSTELSSSLSRRLEYAESLEEMEAIAPLAIGRGDSSEVDGETEKDYRRKSSARTKSSFQGHSAPNTDSGDHGAAPRSSQVDEEPQSDSCPPVYTNVETSARLTRERNVQHCLILMTVVYVIAWSPLKILLLSNPLLLLYDLNTSDREDIEQKLDITYLIFLFFTHLATCLNPVVVIKRLPYGTDTTIDSRLMRPVDIEMKPAINSASSSTDDQPRSSQKKRQSNVTLSSHRSSMGDKRSHNRSHTPKSNSNEYNKNQEKVFGGLEVL